MEKLDTVTGDTTRLEIPAHGDALIRAGADFLSRGFRIFGSLAAGNRVKRITRCEPCEGGSTGRKYYLSVEYERPQPHLHTDLFVKFSRDFADPLRDRQRHELASEVEFAAVSRLPGFPIAVPAAYFADYHRESGTGLLITEAIGFGENGIEPHHAKFLDYDLDDPLEYYEVLVRQLARLAAAHRSGRLPGISARFPYDPAKAMADDTIPFSRAELHEMVSRYADFARACPQLLPAAITTDEWFANLHDEVGLFLEHEAAIRRFLLADPEPIALCHWNAQIDNAWFWRDAAGTLQCGLMDWGRVSQLNLAFALWGCLGGAPLAIWDSHLDRLLAIFVDELAGNGGPGLDPAKLKRHMQMYIAVMGIAWLLDSPARILGAMPDIAVLPGPDDPALRGNETARGYLHIFAAFMYLWRTQDFGATLRRVLQDQAAAR